MVQENGEKRVDIPVGIQWGGIGLFPQKLADHGRTGFHIVKFKGHIAGKPVSKGFSLFQLEMDPVIHIFPAGIVVHIMGVGSNDDGISRFEEMMFVIDPVFSLAAEQ